MWLLAAACSIVAAVSPARTSAAQTPNIVFILADDLGIGDTGVTTQNARAALGLPSFATPNIDRIAREGTRFNNMYAGAAVCSPSRNVLLTGFHQRHTIFEREEFNPDLRAGQEDKTWGQMLQDAGYATGMFGKWHLGAFDSAASYVRTPTALPTQKGFETSYGQMLRDNRVPYHWESDGAGSMRKVFLTPEPTWTGSGAKYEYGDSAVARRAVDFIRSKATAGQPFAAYIPLMEPHSPVDQVPKDHPYVNMPWPQVQRDYAGSIWYLDQHVGQILRSLDDPNNDGDTSDSVANNTIVVFTSDNGPVINNGPGTFDPEFFNSNDEYYAGKLITTEGGIRTPFFVRWSGKIAPGTQNNAVGSFADIYPTLADLVGQDTPIGQDGMSMLSDWLGTGPSERPDSISWGMVREIGTGNPANSTIRVGDWKLLKNRPTAADPNITYRLINVATNPFDEKTLNVQQSRPDIRNALEQILIAEGGDREPYAPATENPSILARQNTYFTQYKSWSPQGGSSDFFDAANWSGGTQYDMPGNPEALNWNTGPADNWLATVANTGPVPQQVAVTANAKVMAIELRGSGGTMALRVNTGVIFTARNGVRISSGGILRLRGGEVNTVRDIEVRPGGQFDGEGLINGQQSVIAGIPDFANKGLFEPRLINRGIVAIGHASNSLTAAGRLLIQGDFTQLATGVLQLDILSNGAVPRVDFDQLAVTGKVSLAGVLTVGVANPELFTLGSSFPLITAGKGLTGVFSAVIATPLSAGLAWSVQYTSTAATLTVVPASNNVVESFLDRWRRSFGVDAAADVDGDGDTDGADLMAWQRGEAIAQAVQLPYLVRWRQSFGKNAGADLDGDGDTDANDFLTWQRGVALGAWSVGSAVPEPASSVSLLTALGAASVAHRRRRR
jgi:arylsulfatase A-like enzyme